MIETYISLTPIKRSVTHDDCFQRQPTCTTYSNCTLVSVAELKGRGTRTSDPRSGGEYEINYSFLHGTGTVVTLFRNNDYVMLKQCPVNLNGEGREKLPKIAILSTFYSSYDHCQLIYWPYN